MTFLHIEDIHNDAHQAWAMKLTAQMGKEYRAINADELTATADPDGFSQWLQQESVDLIFISTECDKRIVQRFLNACRSLRVPYIFLTEEMRKMPVLAEAETAMREILAPVTMLEEEVYKAEILSHLSRYTGARTTLLQAKDYGHRAEQNVGRIRTFLEHQERPLEITMAQRSMEVTMAQRSIEVKIAQRDSMALYKELPSRQKDLVPDMMVLTASREYGLDDLFFGPAERYVILHANVPVMLINPRGDLFSLCD